MKSCRVRLVTSTLLLAGVLVALISCSLEPIPVHPVRVKVAQEARKPVQKGPGAPGSTVMAWNFPNGDGYLYDQGKVEIVGGLARLRDNKSAGTMRYAVTKTTIETSSGRPFVVLETFKETLGPASKGMVKYQLSNDGTKWFHFNGTRWSPALSDMKEANLAAEINAHIGSFHVEAGEGALYLRIFLVSPTGAEPVELKLVEIQAIATKID